MDLRPACSRIIYDYTQSYTQESGPPGTAYQAVDEHLVARPFQGTSEKKIPARTRQHQPPGHRMRIRMCSGPVADSGHPRMARAMHG